MTGMVVFGAELKGRSTSRFKGGYLTGWFIHPDICGQNKLKHHLTNGMG
jgi:hypothetical protein